MKHSSLLLGLVSLLSFAGCALDEPSENDEQPLLDDQVFYQTVVTAMPDGSVQVGEPIPITVAQERAQNEARLDAHVGRSGVAPIVLDPGCGGASLWLYSRTDLYGDRICFVGSGVVALDDLARYVTINGKKYWAGTWAIASGSFWAGVSPGRLANNSESVPGVGGFWSSPFDAYAQVVFNQPTRAHEVVLYQ
jgi:hypothetical protein